MKLLHNSAGGCGGIVGAFQSGEAQDEPVSAGIDLISGTDVGSAGGGSQTSQAAVAVDKDAVFLFKFPCVERIPELIDAVTQC